MNKKLRELLEKIENRKAEARKLLADNKIEEAAAIRDEVVDLQNEFDVAKDLYEQEKEQAENFKPIEAQNDVHTFLNHVRTRFKNAMHEGSGKDGGYIVPQDILTQINEYRESKDALQNLVTVEPVSTKSGSRVFKKRAQQTGFAKVDEMGNIPEKSTPQFTNLMYDVDKYAGFMKVTNELLKDSDQAIASVLTKWIGDESRVTRNKLILEALGAKEKTAFSGPDDIKTALNVTLDPAFRYTSTIVTNQDGYNYLDTLKDETGNYLLQPTVAEDSSKMLFGVPVQVVSNKDMPSNSSKAPVIIGDLKEAVVMFDRQTTEISASDVAGDAYLTDVTLFRAIERLDLKLRDDEAFVYGEIEVTSGGVEG
ncbi:phage major capsid protein [Numidum massiliense]|uniref:phage major capsid protein n=1 Tax=Numidum massiliense TaxID=1522315 RepID=UPI0006D55CA1|nr:phage major capsid protein [Numidum massiliense]